MDETPRKKSILSIVMILIIIACLLIIFVLKVLPMMQGSQEQEEKTVSSSAVTSQQTEEESTVNTGRVIKGDSEVDTETRETITYNGKKYKYNDHLTNILLMGIDKTTDQAYDEESQSAGRSDVLYLISIDRMTGDYTQIKIPRDTVTKIHHVGADGEDYGWQDDHISLSYYFGDGKYKSCELTKEAVSRLLYNVPIQKYAALNLDCIQTLAEVAGEVPVVVPNDSLEEKHPEFRQGETVILTPENTETFVRSRDVEESQTAIARSERQDAYLSAYKAVAKQKAEENIHFVTDLYTALKPYMVTNMDNGEFVDIAEAALGDDETDHWTVPGEGITAVEAGEKVYDQYIVDDEALLDLIIRTFYREVEE